MPSVTCRIERSRSGPAIGPVGPFLHLQMEVPFSPEELKYIAELDGEADAKIRGAETPESQKISSRDEHLVSNILEIESFK